jgi:outer membrane biosynthesis protein TonB
MFLIPCICFVLCTRFRKEKKKKKKKKKKTKERKKKKERETSQKRKKRKKREGFFYCPFPFDGGDDSRTNPFEVRGNDENQ